MMTGDRKWHVLQAAQLLICYQTGLNTSLNIQQVFGLKFYRRWGWGKAGFWFTHQKKKKDVSYQPVAWVFLFVFLTQRKYFVCKRQVTLTCFSSLCSRVYIAKLFSFRYYKWITRRVVCSSVGIYLYTHETCYVIHYVGNGLSVPSSNPRRECLHFT